MRIVVVCEDAGGAAALAPVVRRLVDRGENVVFLLGAVAARVLRARGVAHGDEALADEAAVRARLLGADLKQASVLLTTTTCWGLRLEAQAVLAARAAGCPSFGILDFWSSYVARLSYPSTDDLAAMPDCLAVIDAMMLDDLVELGVERSRLVVTGLPAFDAVVGRGADWLGASGVVLFLSQPIEALHGTVLGYTESRVLAALAPVVAEAGAELVVRPHPREDPVALERFVNALPCSARLQTGADLTSSIVRASVVVGMTTVALIEAAFAGAPVVSAQLDRRGEDGLPTNRMGLTTGVRDSTELRATVLSALRNPGAFLAPSRAAASHFVPDAASRVILALDAFLAGEPTR